MSRLVTTMGWDVRLQFRNGFYYAAGFVALYSILLLSWPSREDRAWILPVFVFSNMLINTFYFLGGLVLLEKREGTLEAQVVTPLRTWEYLASKLVTLTALGLLENLAIVIATYGLGFRILPLLVGMLLAAAIYCLLGFAVVARYDSINEYLMPSFLFTALLSIPLLPYFGLGSGWWFYLHPLHGTLSWIRAAFEPVPAWELIYGLLYPLVWIVPVFAWSRRSFHRFVIAREGAR
jgi:fluoroquinolone transport system permease protein